MRQLAVVFLAFAAVACTQPAQQADEPKASAAVDPAQPWAALHGADVDCRPLDDPAAGPPVSAVAHKLDDNNTLFEVSCALYAYNASTKFYLQTVDGVRPVLGVDYADTTGWYGNDKFINASFDPATKKISTFAKGRGVGDCGSVATYAWSEGSFALTEYRYQEECGGEATADPEKWPLIFPQKK